MTDYTMNLECFFKPFHGFEKTERGEKKNLNLVLLPLHFLRRTNVAMEDNMLTFTDQFCGAGGSSQGVRSAALSIPEREFEYDKNEKMFKMGNIQISRSYLKNFLSKCRAGLFD